MKVNFTGGVGPPVQKLNNKLVNWKEGNYKVTDRRRPRGKIFIGGGKVAK